MKYCAWGAGAGPNFSFENLRDRRGPAAHGQLRRDAGPRGGAAREPTRAARGPLHGDADSLTGSPRAGDSGVVGTRKPSKVRPTPPPSGPALVRPMVGALLLTLGGTAELGCAKKLRPDPPMADPSGDYPPPMPPPPMPDPGDGGDDGDPPPPMPPPMPDAPMPEPEPEPAPEPE